MAKKKTAGLLLYRARDPGLEVFLVHPGGPFWAKKDHGAWSIPKGELQEGEDPLNAAKREFQEETGFSVEGNFVPLTPLKQRGGKVVYAWAVEADCDPDAIKSNMFSMEWPPRSGKRQEFPEVDRAGWFTLEVAKQKILPGQVGFLEELERTVTKNLTGKRSPSGGSADWSEKVRILNNSCDN
jgi:predicted NUDIX family NTP pyrophosphohydrolase